ncbi:MAG: carbamoyl-phosphate synthase large subunit [Bdellovibrionota bacterium]
MPKDTSIDTILLIGSGPITIGQASEFDYSGTQALRALKAEGYRVILVNSNPATIMTDPNLADQIYVEPLTPEFLEMIIERERPDALLPTMGGQTALNLAVRLAESGVLERYGVRMLGANLESIKKAEDRSLFKKTMIDLGIDIPKSQMVHSKEEGQRALEEIGLPMILRPSFTLGGEGGGVAHTLEEFERILERGLFLSPTRSVLVEESLLGWKEFELEVVRDRADNVIIVCSIENLDPMGIHTGDSITVAPAQTLTDRQYQHLRDLSKKIIRAINVETGGSNIQFAVKPSGPNAGRTVVIEMNPRVSRSSALASKATGFPIAKIAARLAVGYTLDELKNEITGTTPASFEPSIDYVVTKIPRFDFEKFTASPPLLGTQMKSVGEVMAIGRTFKESFLKALSSMEISANWLRPTEFDDPAKPLSELETKLKQPLSTRIWYVASALRRGLSPERISELTGIDPWFLDQMQEVIDLEKHLSHPKRPVSEWTKQELLVAKQFGFLDRELAKYSGSTEDDVRKERHKHQIHPTFSQVDTCAGEFEAKTPYLYSTYGDSVAMPKPAGESVMILGSGPNRIGQGIEFDYCCVHASEAVREEGFESIMVNCNPETVSTDYDISSKLYFEPLTIEHTMMVFRNEPKVKGVVVQFGGQTPLKLSGPLSKRGVTILGTSVESIDLAEDRHRFESLMKELEPLGLIQPPSRTASSLEEAVLAADEMGFPIMLRPSYVLGGRGMRIVFSKESLVRYIDEAIEVSEKRPVLMDRFLSNAVEVDVDAVSDGEQVLVGGIMEHIEEAGIHSGDSACSLPPFTLSPEIIERLRKQTRVLAKKLGVVGLINIQFAVQGADIYVLEVNPRASRTIPFVSKAIGVPLAKVATQIMLGKTLAELGFQNDLDLELRTFNVKMPIFPFHKFPNVDVLLGPEMKSTGESMGRSETFPAAYAKALLGVGIKIPKQGRAFLSVADADKPALLEIARKLVAMGFELDATPGTHAFLREHGIRSDFVAKVGQTSPDCTMQIAAGRYQLVINTTSDEKAILDSYSIRRTALERQIPYCTLITTARAFIKAIDAVRSFNLTLSPLKPSLEPIEKPPKSGKETFNHAGVP